QDLDRLVELAELHSERAEQALHLVELGRGAPEGLDAAAVHARGGGRPTARAPARPDASRRASADFARISLDLRELTTGRLSKIGATARECAGAQPSGR